MPPVSGKGKMTGHASRHHRLMKSKKKNSFPSSVRKMCYSQGIPVATEKVYRMIVKLVKCHMEDITKMSCVFAGKRKTLQAKDVEATLRLQGLHIL